MSRLIASDLSRDLAALFDGGTLADLTDGQLLDRFVVHRDDLSFEGLIARHGPMVLAICRRSLDDPRDIEDAFQATFLILVRKAQSLRDRGAVSSWLYGVALRVVRRARENARRRRRRERLILAEPPDLAPVDREILGGEVFEIIHEEIGKLPGNQQVAVIHCLLRGRTHEDAAAELGWPLGTVKSRIAAARLTLTRRLSRRGLSPSGIAAILRPGLGVAGPASPIPPHLIRLVRGAAIDSLATAPSLTAALPAGIAGLIDGARTLMLIGRVQAAGLLVMTLTAMAWTSPALLGARPAATAGPVPARTAPSTRSPASTTQPTTTDRHGDPLPPRAAMRLGSVRFRHEREINHIAYTPDGRFLVHDDRGRFFQVRDPKTCDPLRRIDSGLEEVRYFAFSPDGTTIAAVGNLYDEGRNVTIHRLSLTDFATGRHLGEAEWDDPRNVRRVFHAPDGRTLLTVTETAGFQLWDIATMKIIYRDPSGETWGPEVAISPAAHSHLLAIAGPASIRLFDTERLRDIRTIAGEEHQDGHVLFSPDGKMVAAKRRLRETNHVEVCLWRVSDGAPLRRFSSRKTASLSALTFAPDGKILSAIGDRDQIVCFEVATGAELDTLPSARAPEGPLAFSPDGTTLTTLAGSQTLHFWDRTTGKDRLAIPDAHQDSVRSIAFADAARTLVSVGGDRTIRFWELATGRPTKVVPYDGPLGSLAVRADGSLVAAGPDDTERNVRVWNPETGVTLHSWPLEVVENMPLFDEILISGDASWVLATRSDGALQRWDLATGEARPVVRPKLVRRDGRDFDGHYSFLSHDGRSMALASLEGTILLVDVPTGRVRFETFSAIRDPEYTDNVNHQPTLEFAPDGQSLAFIRPICKSVKLPDGRSRDVVPRESTIVWLDARTGQSRREIRVPGRPVWAPVFSPDGRLLAGISSTPENGSAIRIFRLGDRKEIQSIETPSQRITALAFTPDGKRIAAGLYDTSIVLWDVRRTD